MLRGPLIPIPIINFINIDTHTCFLGQAQLRSASSPLSSPLLHQASRKICCVLCYALANPKSVQQG